MRTILLFLAFQAVLIAAKSHAVNPRHPRNKRSPSPSSLPFQQGRPLLSTSTRSEPVRRFSLFSHARRPRDLPYFDPLNGVHNVILHRGLALDDILNYDSPDLLFDPLNGTTRSLVSTWKREFEDRILWTPAHDDVLTNLIRRSEMSWGKRHGDKSGEDDGYGDEDENDDGDKGSKYSDDKQGKHGKGKGNGDDDGDDSDDDEGGDAGRHKNKDNDGGTGRGDSDDEGNDDEVSKKHQKHDTDDTDDKDDQSNDKPKKGGHPSKSDSSQNKNGNTHQGSSAATASHGKVASSPSASAKSISPDCKTLAKLYAATGGDGWTDNTGWNSGACCTSNPWFGVGCSSSRVTSLHLSFNGLTGEISALFNLTSLVIVDISGNSIVSLPNTFDRLPSLQTLNASSNSIVSALPLSLFSVPNLKTLDLSNNQFTGSLPSSNPPSTLGRCVILPNQNVKTPNNHVPNSWADKCGMTTAAPPATPSKGKSIPVNPLPGEALGQQYQQIQPSAGSQSTGAGQAQIPISGGQGPQLGPGPVAFGRNGLSSFGLRTVDSWGVSRLQLYLCLGFGILIA